MELRANIQELQNEINCMKLITLLHVMHNFDEINFFFKNNDYNKIGIFVMLMRKVLLRWKDWSDFKGLHSIQFRGENWSKIKILSLISRPEFRNTNSLLRTTKRTRISSTSYRDDCSRKRWETKERHNSNADICKKAVDHEFIKYRSTFLRIPWLDSEDSKHRNCNSTKFPSPQSFLCWKIRFEKSSDHLFSDFPSEAMLWIKEVEMVDSLEEFESSRSITGKNFPFLWCWTRRLLLLCTRSSQIPNSRRRSVSRNRKPRKRTGF